MTQNKLNIIKSLHVCLRLPIIIFDKDFNIVREYRSNRTTLFFYNYKSLLNRIVNNKYFFYYLTGNVQEMFLLYRNGEFNYLFGPFRCNIIDKKIFELKIKDYNIDLNRQKVLYEELNQLPLFSLGDIRDLLMLVHYFFTGKIEDLLHDQLNNYVTEFKESYKYSERYNDSKLLNYDTEVYTFLYENKLLEYVKSGDIEKLRKMIFHLVIV